MVKEGNRGSEKKLGEKSAFIGIILTVIFFTYLLFSGFSQNQNSNLNNTQIINEVEFNVSEEKPNKVCIQASAILPPSIKIRSPENTTYNKTPDIDFVVAGNLNSVILFIDGEKIPVPHDSAIASVDESITYREFNETFEEPESFRKWSEPSRGYTAVLEEFGGDNCIRIFTYNPSKGWSWIKREFDVIPSVWYTVSAEMRVHNMQGLHIAVDGYSDKGWKRLVTLGGKSTKWEEYSASFYVPHEVKKIRINLNAGWSLDGTNPAYAWIDDIRIYPHPAIQLINNRSVLFIKELEEGYHNLTIFANNTAGESNTVTVGFKISRQEEGEIAEEKEEEIYGMRDTITRGDIAVTLEGYSPDYTVQSYSGSKIIELKYTRVNLTIENRGEEEITLHFTPYEPVLIGYRFYPGRGEIYDYMKLRIKREDGIVIEHPDQIEKDVIFPDTEKEGAIFFYPSIDSDISKLKLILYLNNEKFEFIWDRSRLG